MALTHAALTDQSIATAAVDAVVEDTFDLVNATLTLQETGGLLTASGAEQTLYINDAPLGTFRPVCLFIDLDNMAAGGDSVTVRTYYRIVDGGGLQLFDTATYVGVDGGLAGGRKLIAIDLYPTRFGLRASLDQTAGTLRTFRWSAFVEN